MMSHCDSFITAFSFWLSSDSSCCSEMELSEYSSDSWLGITYRSQKCCLVIFFLIPPVYKEAVLASENNQRIILAQLSELNSLITPFRICHHFSSRSVPLGYIIRVCPYHIIKLTSHKVSNIKNIFFEEYIEYFLCYTNLKQCSVFFVI